MSETEKTQSPDDNWTDEAPKEEKKAKEPEAAQKKEAPVKKKSKPKSKAGRKKSHPILKAGKKKKSKAKAKSPKKAKPKKAFKKTKAAAGKKQKLVNGRIVMNFKTTPSEAEKMKAKARRLVNGNMTQMVRLAVLAWKPSAKSLEGIRKSTRA